MKYCAFVLALALQAFTGGVALASTPKLAIGDPAPSISVKQWIKHGPIDIAAGKGKHIYVLKFWASWYEPGLEAIPYVNELQRKYRDRGVIFMSLTDEAPSAVRAFVKKMGANMDYAVGIDPRDQTYKTYMAPFDQDNIPYAFIIDKQGLLVWHGHPVGGLAQALDELLSGKYNMEAARKRDRVDKLQLQYIEWVNAPATRQRAAEIGDTILSELSGNAGGLNAFAWKILTDRRIKHRDTALALNAAKSAQDLGGSKNAAMLDTYARALFEAGQKQAAIEQQKAAIALAKDEGTRIEYEGTLNKYKRLLREGR